MKKILALLLSLLFILSGCGVKFTYPDLSENLARITDKTLLKSLLLENAPNRNWYETMKGGDLAQAVKDNGSKTNTQVNGIDEGDTVKTNGTLIVNILNNKVYVISVETNKIVKTFDYEPAKDDKTYRWASELYLTDTQLIIMGTISTNGGGMLYREGGADLKSMWWGYWGAQDTFIEIVDIANMKTTASYELKGGYFSSRMSNDQLIVIANQWQTLMYDAKDNPEVVEPTCTNLKDGSVISSLDKGTAYILPNNQGNTFVNILKVDLTLNNEPTLSSFLGGIQTVYMNETNLIIAQSRYEYNEKTQVSSNFTDLLRFDVASLELKAQGSAKGYLLNQFSLDIYDKTLRVALTNWDTISTNRVVTFDMNMKKLDSIENLAEKETIRSVRFIKDKAYVVTFENIDPLFVLDLSDPSNISVKGELKIPGFSTYLHPVSDTVLWGIAEDIIVKPITQNGQTFNTIERFGVKISLFDVSDPSHPSEITTLNIMGPSGYSEAQYNHKAIVLDDVNHLVYIPYSDYHYDTVSCTKDEKGNSSCNTSFESGIKVLQITENSVKLVKTISVSSSDNQNTWINRSVYVGNKLYMMSSVGITIVDRNSFDKLGAIVY